MSNIITPAEILGRVLQNLRSDAQFRFFAVRCARRVQHLMIDPRSLAALDVAERHARGEATDEELIEARNAARSAADAAELAESGRHDAARAAACCCARIAWMTVSAAKAAAKAAARASARWRAADAAWEAEHVEQQRILNEIREEPL